MSIDEQLANLAGQEIVLNAICYGVIQNEPLAGGKLCVLPNGNYQVERFEFSGRYVTKIDRNQLLFDLDLQSEDAVASMYDDCDPREIEAELYEEARREGEAHMRELRKMGWEG